MADLADGESTEMQGSGRSPYILKNTGGVYSCTCPAWRNQSIPIERRTCKHLRKLRGDAAETERAGSATPVRKPANSAGEDASDAGPPLLLAHAWENDIDLSGWWMSEKLDGVRAYWDGRRFVSRQGNEFHAPDWFVAGFPTCPLDGELWIERKSFQKTVSIVRRQDKSDHWKEIRYLVFDAPSRDEVFEDRVEYVAEVLQKVSLPYIQSHKHQLCRDIEHLQSELRRVESLGGEGLMLRQPGSRYEAGRSMTLLKVKTFHDAEALVIDHIAGKGRHKGRLGALVVQLSDGTEFSVGTGFTDKQRQSPPAIGSRITFRYQEFSDGGVPRFPSFVRLHADVVSQKMGSVPTPTTTSSKSGRTAPSSKPTVLRTSEPCLRYFEFVDGNSSKFWEITASGTEVVVRYGRIGANGQTQSKSFPDSERALAHAEKLIRDKTGKGYVETPKQTT